MDWQTIGTIGALIGVVASFGLTVRGQKQDRELSHNSASRAEAAARLTEGYTARVVEALETIAAAGTFTAPTAAPERVRWSMNNRTGSTYILENIGSATAWSVKVTGHKTLLGPDMLQDKDDIASGEAVTFRAAQTMATSDTTITVTWSTDPDDPANTTSVWQYPLPPGGSTR